MSKSLCSYTSECEDDGGGRYRIDMFVGHKTTKIKMCVCVTSNQKEKETRRPDKSLRIAKQNKKKKVSMAVHKKN